MKKKILITGGAGFIGSHLVNSLIDQGCQVVVIDNLSSGNKKNLPSKAKLVKLDIQNPQLTRVFSQFRPHAVFHLAANSSVSSSSADNLSDNVIGTFNVLQATKLAKAKQFVFTSSAAVYGETKIIPTKETSATKPISSYGIAKLTGELYCQIFQDSFKTSVLRLANVYGPGQNSSAEGGVVAIFIHQLLRNKLPIIFGTGKQTRDFVFVKDVVEAMTKVLDNQESLTINLSTNNSTSIQNLLKEIAGLMSRSPRFRLVDKKAGDIQTSQLNNSLAKTKLNWQPQTSLQEGLTQTINYFRSQ